MAIRDLLHLSKVFLFRNWLEKRGWTEVPVKSPYEIIRMTNPGTNPLIIYRKEGCDHATFEDKHLQLVRMFIQEREASKQPSEYKEVKPELTLLELQLIYDALKDSNVTSLISPAGVRVRTEDVRKKVKAMAEGL